MSLLTPSEVFEAAEASEEIAEKIKEIHTGVQKVLNSGLTERALILLINDASGVGKKDIKSVLDAMESISDYLVGEQSE